MWQKNIVATLEKLQAGTIGKKDPKSRSAAVPVSGADQCHYWKRLQLSSREQEKVHPPELGKVPKDRKPGISHPYKRWGGGLLEKLGVFMEFQCLGVKAFEGY